MKSPWRLPHITKFPARMKLKLKLRLREEDTLSRPLSTLCGSSDITRDETSIVMRAAERYTYNDLGEILDHPRQRVGNISLLHAADLIAFPRELLSDTHWMGYWHLAIVENVDLENKIINVIHYQPTFDDTYQSKGREASKFEKGTVVRTPIYFHDDQVWIVELAPDKCLPAEEVLERARSRIGENEYNVLANNCESFAFWCKTGTSCSEQSDTALRMAARYMSRTAGKVGICRGILKSVVTKAPGIGKKAVRRTGGLFAAVDVAIGSGLLLRDIFKAKKKLKQGDINEDEYNASVGTLVAVATGDMSCSAVGSVAGAALAGPVGAVIGATIGSGIGTVLGSATAKAVVNSNSK